MGVDLVADPGPDLRDRGLEALVGEGLDLAAVRADEMVMMLARRQRGLVARDAAADVDSLQQTVLREQVDHAVDAGDADLAILAAEDVEDLLRRQATVLPPEQLDDVAPCAAAAVPRVTQGRKRVLGPRIHRHRHAPDDTVRGIFARIVLIFILTAIAASCGGGGSDDGDRTTSVVAGFYPLAFAAERIGGNRVDVTNLTPPGAEPHDVELSARDVERVRSADLVLYLGDGFQPALEEAVDGADGRVVNLLDGLPLLDEGGDVDPHVWLDPVRYERIVERIGQELGAAARARALEGNVRALDREYGRGLASCRRNEIVTSHAAFGYLAARYGLDQIAVTGLAPEAEPTPGELQRTVDEVRSDGATTIFFEPLVSPRLAETVARETGAGTAVLNPLEGLTEDELAAGEDYLSVMRANLAALREALGCR